MHRYLKIFMLVDAFFLWKNYAKISIIKNKLYKKGEKI